MPADHAMLKCGAVSQMSANVYSMSVCVALRISQTRGMTAARLAAALLAAKRNAQRKYLCPSLAAPQQRVSGTALARTAGRTQALELSAASAGASGDALAAPWAWRFHTQRGLVRAVENCEASAQLGKTLPI